MNDLLPALVCNFAKRERDAFPLLREVVKNVAAVSRGYPDAYFALGRKTPEAVEDLAHRVFTSCARTCKTRFPFQGRTPFRTYADEKMDGRTIRYHSFYARLSITREMMRDDYASNVCRDPALKRGALLYSEVGAALRELADPVSTGKPAVWRLKGQGLMRPKPHDQVIDALAASGLREVPELVTAAMKMTGPVTQSRLTGILAEILNDGPVDAPATEESEDDPTLTLSVREAVLDAWGVLEPADQALMLAVARGDAYDDLLERFPDFKHKVALTRAVQRCNKLFLERVASRLGAAETPAVAPQQLAEAILEVLVTCLPELDIHQSQGDLP